MENLSFSWYQFHCGNAACGNNWGQQIPAIWCFQYWSVSVAPSEWRKKMLRRNSECMPPCSTVPGRFFAWSPKNGTQNKGCSFLEYQRLGLSHATLPSFRWFYTLYLPATALFTRSTILIIIANLKLDLHPEAIRILGELIEECKLNDAGIIATHLPLLIDAVIHRRWLSW